MHRKIQILILVLLLAGIMSLSSCLRPEGTTSIDSLDPIDTRSQEEILEEIFAQTDGPVVVQVFNPRGPFLFQSDLASMWNAPHVLNVMAASIIHWIDISADNSLSMIGLYYPDLDPEAISVGRWFEDKSECCVNRAEYERLLADPQSGFSGIGDTITYTEPELVLSPGMFVQAPEQVSVALTVVGIVDNEGAYAGVSYGIRHVYALFDTVNSMLANYKPDNEFLDCKTDRDAYILTAASEEIEGMLFYQENIAQGGAVLRCAEDKTYTAAEWYSLFQSLPCNAGYTVEVTLDSGKNYADFIGYMRSLQFSERSAKDVEDRRIESIERTYAYYEEQLLTRTSKEKADAWLSETLNSFRQNPTIARLIELDELDVWYACNFKAPYVIHPLRVEE